MDKVNTAKITGQPDNVIYFQPPHDSQPVNVDGATDIGIFYQPPQSTPEEIDRGVEDSQSVENQDEYCRKDNVAYDIENCTATQLSQFYPGAYTSWKNIKQRCRRGKGVLHPDFEKFPGFLLALGPRPAPSYTVDRVGHANPEYSPTNTRWASKPLQTANRRSTRLLTDSQGTTRPAAEWARLFGLTSKLILQRVDRGWSVDDAVKTPAGDRRSASLPPGDNAATSRNKPRKPQFPDHTPAVVQSMLDTWSARLKKHHDNAIFLLEFKHLKMAEYIYEGLLRCWVDPAKTVAFILDHWYDFSKHTLDRRGSNQLPDLALLKNYIMDAAHYYRVHGGEPLDWPDNQTSKPWDGIDWDKEL